MIAQNHPKTFKVYTASAGSGKTFRLTLEYLKIALSQPEDKFRKILAITFTVKATNEMKARIIEACKSFSEVKQVPLSGRNKALFEALQQEVEWSEAEIIDRAARLYKKILHNYSDFSISTIDSFSQRLIRSFAFELKLPIQFEVIIDPSTTVDYLLSEVLAQVGGKDKAFTNLMIAFFRNKLHDDDSIYIEGDIEKAIHVLFDDDNVDALNNLSKLKTKEFQEIAQKLSKRTKELKDAIHQIANAGVKEAKQAGYQISDFKYGKTGAFNALEKVAKDPYYKLSGRFQNTASGEMTWLKEKQDNALEHSLTQKSKQILELSSELKLNNLLRKNFSQIALLAKISTLYKAYKKEEEILLISEFNRTINQEVRGQPAPFIYEKIGEYFDHILLDEFQDTSVIQWHNLVPLVAEILSQEEHPESIVVGDSKQAIYRFRGGETKQLTHLPKLIGSDTDFILQEQENVLSLYAKHEQLAYNYRSKEEIVKFNNQLFGFIEAHPELQAYHDIYQTYYQKVNRKNSGGYVSIHLLEQDKEEAKEEFLSRRLELLVEQINDAHNRGYSFSQMAILCRKNDELRAAADSLQLNGIPFVSKESLALNKEKYITTFPALVQYFTMPDNQILQAQILNSFQSIGIIDAENHQLNLDVGHKKMTTVKQFSNYVKQYNASIELEELNYTELLGLFEMYCSWLPHSIQQSSFISFFRDELWKVIQKEGNNIEAFLDWWAENNHKLFVKSSEQAEGVNLLTIHKAKGLEFEVVFLPFADWRITQNSLQPEYRWLHTNLLGEKMDQVYLPMRSNLEGTEFEDEYLSYKEDHLLDHINLLYVATTRAVSELHIISKKENRKKAINQSSNVGMLWAHFLENDQLTEQTYGQPVILTGKMTAVVSSNDFKLGQTKTEFGAATVAVKNKASVIWSDNVRDKIDFGELVHSLLEQINHPTDVKPVVWQAVAQGLVEQNDVDELEKLIDQVVNHEELRDFFSNQFSVLAEQPIISPDGKEAIPDRIVMKEGTEVKILDFKTGVEQSKHKTQIENYATLLQQMGYTIISKQIVYLQPFKIVRL